MSAEIVQDDDVAGLQHGGENVGDVVPEALAIRGSVKERRGNQAGRAQGGRDGRGLVVPVRDSDPTALAARGAPIAASHSRGRGGLVQEDEPVWVEVRLSVKPALTRLSYILSLLLSCVGCPFFRVMPCRAKKRDRLLVLVSTP